MKQETFLKCWVSKYMKQNKLESLRKEHSRDIAKNKHLNPSVGLICKNNFLFLKHIYFCNKQKMKGVASWTI